LAPRLLICSLAAAAAFAHDIPRDVTVQLFLKPDAKALHLLARVPLQAMRDINFPTSGPEGFLDFERTAPLLPDAAQLWISNSIDLYENDHRLGRPRVAATRTALESDRSFATYESAAAHLRGPESGNDVRVFWNQILMDVEFVYPIESDQSRFSIEPKLGRLGLRVVTVLRWLPRDGVVRALEFTGDPGLVRLDPSWTQAAGRFVRLGFEHIWEGIDHLLFLLCLVIPLRKFMALVPVVTAFTVAHSTTLIASAYNLAPDALWFPPLIEVLIAASIVYMALENIVKPGGARHRWMIAFGFGLVHGFGFSFALRDTLQFAGSHLLTSLLSFNIGVELGQLLALLIAIPILNLLFRYVMAERIGTIILSAFVAHTGWHWMLDRWAVLEQYRFSAPSLNALFWAGAMRWAAATLAAAGVLWMIERALASRAQRKP
jgi:hypothetical protein